MMKKKCFIVLFALLTFTLNNYAQDDASQDGTYNMVVKMPDGTTFTVNTDDVEEVSFSNGKVTVSGQTLTDLLQRISQQNNRIDSLRAATDENYDRMLLQMYDYVKVSDLVGYARIEDLQSVMNDLYNSYDRVSALESNVAYLNAYNAQLVNNVSSLEAINATLVSKVATLEAINATLASNVTTLEANNAALAHTVASLADYNALLRNEIEGLYMRIEALESSMAELLDARVKQERQNTTTTNP